MVSTLPKLTSNFDVQWTGTLEISNPDPLPFKALITDATRGPFHQHSLHRALPTLCRLTHSVTGY